MKISIPLLVEGRSKPLEYTVRPLFFPGLVSDSSALLQRSLSRVQDQLWRYVEEKKRTPLLESFQALLYHPPLQERTVDVRLIHRKKTVQCRLLVILIEAWERQVGYCPQVPGLWFDATGDGPLDLRLAEVLRAHLKETDKRGEALELDGLGSDLKAWVQPYEFETAAPGVSKPERPPSLMALLGGDAGKSGSQELREVGRNLGREIKQHPQTCVGRELEADELQALLDANDRAAVLVVGPRQVGKSALIREAVRRAESRVGKKSRRKSGQYWFISPGRLIAGMSVVGQWETRWTAILRHVRAQNHVLVLDDMLGLLQAGISRDSNLNAAQLLKAYLDRREVRVMAEITPESYQILRQKDTAFADLFQVVRLHPTPENVTVKVALATVREVEETQATAFSLEAARTVLEIARRYLTDAAFPGKSAALIHQLAARFRRKEVDREQVLLWFSQRSGLSLELLDERRTLSVLGLEAELRKRILGQDEAVAACMDVVSIAKATLREGGRPLAGMLFLGPTGVGKTECAKALAEVLFGSSDRLLRIDMNEYIGDDSVARLVGSDAGGTPGRLTQAIRRQPFSVVLLDEIEKAHPAVLQLLLQLLGDARLTEASGLTADFSQAIVILTSNLGALEQRQAVGLRSRADKVELVYRKAAEEFFSPELFNRLDRIVPFRPLTRETVGLLAHRQLDRVLSRDGLSRRQCLLEVSAEALALVTEAGFHPTLGARALKRTVEEQITAPVASRLAGLSPETPTRISIAADRGELQVSVQKMVFAACRAVMFSQEDTDVKLGSWLEQWASRLSQVAPEGSVSHEDLSPDKLFYFEIQDSLRQLRGAHESWRARYIEQRRTSRRRPPESMWQFSPEEIAEVTASRDLTSSLAELRERFPLEARQHQMSDTLELWSRAAWLQSRWHHRLAEGGPTTLELSVAGRQRDRLRRYLMDTWKSLDLQARNSPTGISLEGPLLPEQEQGIHLFLQGDELSCVDVGPPLSVAAEGMELEVIRIYAPDGSMLDLRTGILAQSPRALPLIVLATLTLPEEGF